MHLSHLWCLSKSQCESLQQAQTLDQRGKKKKSPLNTHQSHTNHTVRNLFNECSNHTTIPAGSPSHGGDVTVFVFNINQPSLPTLFYSVLVSIPYILPTVLRFLCLTFVYVCYTSKFVSGLILCFIGNL